MTWATALAWALKHWKLIVWLVSTGALLLALAVQKGETAHWHKEADSKEAALKLSEAGRTADRLTFAKAQAESNALAQAQARAKDQQNAKLKEEADNAYLDRERIAASYSSLSQWMREHPAQSGPGRGDMPGATSTAALDHGAGGIAAVDESTLQICTRNTERLLNAHEWGAALSATNGDKR